MFLGTTNCENKNFKLIFSLRPGSGREGLIKNFHVKRVKSVETLRTEFTTAVLGND